MIEASALRATLCLPIALLAGEAAAGGLYLNEFMSPEQGAAGAGAEALAENPSTIFTNPAGLTEIKGERLLVGAGVISGDVKFSPADDTPIGGGSGGQQATEAPVAALYYSKQIDENFTAGFGLYSISGAALDPNNDWAGRFQVTDVELLTLTAGPSLAYKCNDRWSAGVSVGMTLGSLDFDLAAPGARNGDISLDGTDVKPVFNFGVLYKPTDRLRLGLQGFSGTNLTFDGELKGPRGRKTDADTTLTLPAMVRFGGVYEATPEVDLLFTVGWDNWGDFDNIVVETDNRTADLARNWSDTWHFAGGVRWKATDKLSFRTGVAFDTSPVSKGDRTADMPIDRQWRFAAGLEYAIREDLTLGVSGVYVDMGNAKIDNDTLSGHYKENQLYVIGVSLDWKM